jgi:hypothetical protein
MIHPNDSTDNHVAAERNALAAELLAARVAAPEPAVVTIPPELQKQIDRLPPDEGLRSAGRRERLWLIWHTSKGMGPAAIRDRWNGLAVEIRKAISPRCFATFTSNKAAGSNRVKQALIRARRESTPKPKTARRTMPKPKTRKT